MVYQIESYDYWRQYLGRNDLHYGHFGENLTIEGLADAEVCIGDRYQIGTAIFEVSQPRVTCYKAGISLGIPQMQALLVAHKRPGFYFRVIQEGALTAGDAIHKLSAGPEGMTVVEVDQLLYSSKHPKDGLTGALNIPALSKGWQSSFSELLKASLAGITTGNTGLTGAQGLPLAWAGYRRCIIKKISMEIKDVRSFELIPEDRGPLPSFQAGQHLAVRIRNNPSAPPLIRMYSLCGPPGADSYRIAVKRELEGQGSSWMFEHCREGDGIEISAPRGTFTLLPGSGPVSGSGMKLSGKRIATTLMVKPRISRRRMMVRAHGIRSLGAYLRRWKPAIFLCGGPAGLVSVISAKMGCSMGRLNILLILLIFRRKGIYFYAVRGL